MTLREDMRTALQAVPTFLGETYEYRRMTSGPAVPYASRTYGSWTSFTAHVTGRMNTEEYDEKRGSTTRKERGKLRVTDALAKLHQGDQVRDTTTTVDAVNLWWAVVGMASSGVGTYCYDIERDVPLKASPDRGALV